MFMNPKVGTKLLLVLFSTLLWTSPARAKLTDVGREQFNAFFVAESREEAVASLFRWVQADDKDELVDRLLHCENPAAVEWATQVVESAPQAAESDTQLQLRVALVILARHEKATSTFGVRGKHQLTDNSLRFGLTVWEVDLMQVMSSKAFPVRRVTPEIRQEWDVALEGDLADERKAELRDLVELIALGRSPIPAVNMNDAQYLLHLHFLQGPVDTGLLDLLWANGLQPNGIPLKAHRNALIRTLGAVEDKEAAEWMTARLVEIRDTPTLEMRELTGSTYGYLEIKAHASSVRGFLEQTILQSPGNYYPELPRLIHLLRFDVGPARAESSRAMLQRIENHFQRLADTAADSAEHYPAKAWVISEP